jgi:glycosyltransferase involved in cell wall biosynthesis
VRIAFIDTLRLDWDVATPWTRPLGGSQSAVAFLALELVALGHTVTVFNPREAASEVRGVTMRPTTEAARRSLGEFDAVVRVNFGDRRGTPTPTGGGTPVILWTQHAPDQRDVRMMKDPNARGGWDGIAMVSEWQAIQYEQQFGVPRERMRIVRNASSPIVAVTTPSPPWFARGAPPVLVYTSTPFRGLDRLLLAFPSIREAFPGARLHVYSSMGVYGIPAEKDDNRWLYLAASALPGVEHRGSVGQVELADALARSDVFAYPNTFPETSCIAVMEALASGLVCVVTDLGALPETTAGRARVVPFHRLTGPAIRAFVEGTVEAMRSAERDPDAWTSRRDEQVRWARTELSWAARAREWVAWIEALRAGS